MATFRERIDQFGLPNLLFVFGLIVLVGRDFRSVLIAQVLAISYILLVGTSIVKYHESGSVRTGCQTFESC